jgi:hypothetical protein
MCDVPSIAVFCSGSIECLPGTASKFFLKLLVTIPVAPILLLLLLLLLLMTPGSGEIYIMRSLMICTPHPILCRL